MRLGGKEGCLSVSDASRDAANVSVSHDDAGVLVWRKIALLDARKEK